MNTVAPTHRTIAVIGVMLVSFAGCATTARLYDLDGGSVIRTTFTNLGVGHGRIVGTMPDGEPLEGEYSTLSNMRASAKTARAQGLVAGQYSWASAQGFSFDTPGVQYGAAVLSGRDKTVVEIVYVVDPWTSHGTGVGRDNKGRRYRVQF